MLERNFNFWSILVAGVIATTAIGLAVSLIHRSKITHRDFLQALGSMVTKQVQGSFFTGLLIHYFMGILFAFIYAYLISLAPIKSISEIIILGVCLGLFHGFGLYMFVAIAVASYHPLKKYKIKSGDVVAAYVLGHVVYGFFLGVTLSLI